jgi:putative membrane protein
MKAGMKAALAAMTVAGALAMNGVAVAAGSPTIQSVVGGPMNGMAMPRPSHAWVYVFVGVMAAAYLGAIFKTGRRPEWWQTLCFFASLTVTAAVVAGPLDRLAWQRVFVAYITEQILLVMLAAPLLLLGLPDWMLRPVLTRPGIRPVVRLLTRAPVAFGAFTVVFATIHYPLVCNQICHARPFYGGIRAALLAAGLLLWWPLLSPMSEFPRLPSPLQILYLFLLIIPMTAVAAPITLAQSVIYTWLDAPQPWGMTALSDQRIGGILMWIGQALILMIAASAVFLRWAQQEGE